MKIHGEIQPSMFNIERMNIWNLKFFVLDAYWNRKGKLMIGTTDYQRFSMETLYVLIAKNSIAYK